MSAGGRASEPWREPWLRELLRCPVDRAELRDGELPGGGPALLCTDPGHRVAFPVADGVPVLLADDAVPLIGDVDSGAGGAGGGAGAPGGRA